MPGRLKYNNRVRTTRYSVTFRIVKEEGSLGKKLKLQDYLSLSTNAGDPSIQEKTVGLSIAACNPAYLRSHGPLVFLNNLQRCP